MELLQMNQQHFESLGQLNEYCQAQVSPLGSPNFTRYSLLNNAQPAKPDK